MALPRALLLEQNDQGKDARRGAHKGTRHQIIYNRVGCGEDFGFEEVTGGF